jgi:hypothetical protein
MLHSIHKAKGSGSQMKKVEWKTLDIKPHHIVVAWTSEPDYEMSRLILLEKEYNVFIVLEGSHCSCYDFDDTEWEAIEYTKDELTKLATIKIGEDFDYYGDKAFWKLVKEWL